MEKIKFEGWETLFPIESIQPVAVHVLRIIFSDLMPNDSGYEKNIIIYSQGGIEEGTLTGWNTIYYKDAENKTVYLSDDGSVYAEPEEPQTGEPDTSEPYEPTVEELQNSKIAVMQAACEQTITAGVDVAISDGTTGHYSLATENQLDLMTREFEVEHVVDQIPYHADGELSRYYSVEDMKKIIDTAQEFINYQETYCNELCLWIKTLTDKDEIEAVYYGIDIPEEHQSPVLKDYILHGKDEMRDQDEDTDDDDTSDDTDDDTGGGSNEGFDDSGRVGFGGDD